MLQKIVKQISIFGAFLLISNLGNEIDIPIIENEPVRINRYNDEERVDL